MASGRECSVTGKHFVDWALIDARLGLHAILHGQEVDHRHLNEELLGVTLLELLGAVVPLAALEVKAVEIAARLWLSLDVLVAHLAHHDVRETDLIDRNRVLSGIVLLSSSEESLWEEEAGDPEDIRGAIVVPVLQEIDTIVAVLDPGGERLLTEEALALTVISPHVWHLIIVDRGCHLLQILRHDKLTN